MIEKKMPNESDLIAPVNSVRNSDKNLLSKGNLNTQTNQIPNDPQRNNYDYFQEDAENEPEIYTTKHLLTLRENPSNQNNATPGEDTSKRSFRHRQIESPDPAKKL